MPLFEYECKECKSKYEVFHKSQNSEEDTSCPECHSKETKKLFSSFSASVDSGFSSGSSGGGSIPGGGCASGMCGLN